MNKQQALARMISPGMKRKDKRPPHGVLQVHVTRACDKSCFNCTQGSQLRGPYPHMTPEQFEVALKSLDGYFGTIGMFGGNPAVHPQFQELCTIMREYVPYERRGLWCNNPVNLANAMAMQKTFNPKVSNLNVHLDQKAYDLFKQGWPESLPFGLHEDSRHSPPFVAMKDVLKKLCPSCFGDGIDAMEGRGMLVAAPCSTCGGTGSVYDEEKAWELISECDINKHWSAMVCVFRGELRGFFCEIAGAQAMLHQHEPDYPDTGVPIPFDGVMVDHWWQLPMTSFANQVRKHCHECGVPLRGYGELAQATDGEEQVSATHLPIYQPKRKERRVEVVESVEQLGNPLERMTQYLQNASK